MLNFEFEFNSSFIIPHSAFSIQHSAFPYSPPRSGFSSFNSLPSGPSKKQNRS